MKALKYILICVAGLGGLIGTNLASATTIYDVDATAYQWVNTDNTTDSGGLFTNASGIPAATDGYLWSGPSTNISGDTTSTFTTALNNFFADPSNTFSGDGPTTFTFDSIVKDDGPSFDNPINADIAGVLLNQGTYTLLVLFHETVTDPIYWNTLFGPGDGSDISHYVLLNMNEVPVPAALWLFAPALLGLFGLRKHRHAT